MCVTTERALLSGTIGAAWEQTNNDTTVHYMGYQNRMQNRGDGPNSMLLHIPAVPDTLSPSNFIDTTTSPKVLKDMELVIPKVHASVSRSMSVARERPAMVFDVGMYTVVLAQNASRISNALELVPERKRPSINPELLQAYDKWFPTWAIALCCFDNSEYKESHPMIIQYAPQDPNRLFIPGLDSHTGNVPDLNSAVSVNHTVIFGTDRYNQYLEDDVVSVEQQISALKRPNSISQPIEEIRALLDTLVPYRNTEAGREIAKPGYEVNYTDAGPLQAQLPERVVGWHLPQGYMINGDFSASVEAVRRGLYVKHCIDRVTPK
jgi:hypothetical protein